MNVVDSSGWLEFFTEGKNADFFFPAIQNVDELIVPAICIYEVFKRVLALRGKEEALQAVGVMSLGKIMDLDRQIALDAANIANELKLAMADSIILATTRANDATLWTEDEHFKNLDEVRFINK